MKRVFALLLALCLIAALLPAAAATDIQYHYSSFANSGVRHELCTTLNGTSALDYYTGDYSFSALSSQDSDALLDSLRTLLTETHTSTSSYNDCHYKAVRTDCENGDGQTISLLYTSYSATEADWINNNSDGWNREHVWPQSLGGFKTSGAGADLHHIRPSDIRVNALRGNRKYGNVTGGSTAMASIAANTPGGTYNSTYFEPVDNAKGDVARIILYMYVRYGGDSRYTCSSITRVFQSVDVLLEWCALDPVDTWEMGRNEVVENLQGNRNVFIDYPELAWLLFDREIPTNLQSPSSGQQSEAPPECTHSRTSVYAQTEASCSAEGYTGDTVCLDCGKVLEAGTVIPTTDHVNRNKDMACDACGEPLECGHGKTYTENAKEASCTASGYSGDLFCAYCDASLEKGKKLPNTGHTEQLQDQVDPSCTADGYTGDRVCAVCGETLSSGESIPATGHSFGDWTVTQEATTVADGIQERSCAACGETEVQTIPAIAETTAPSTPSSAPTDGLDADPTSPTVPSADGQPEKNQQWLLICVILFAACLSGLIAFFIINNKQRKPNKNAEKGTVE